MRPSRALLLSAVLVFLPLAWLHAPAAAAPTNEEYMKVKAAFEEWCKANLPNPQFTYDVKQVTCTFANGEGFATIQSAPANPRGLFRGDFNADLGGIPAVTFQGRTGGDLTTASVEWVRGNWAVAIEKHRAQPAAQATPQVYAQFAKEAMDLAKSFDARFAFVSQSQPGEASPQGGKPSRSIVMLREEIGCLRAGANVDEQMKATLGAVGLMRFANERGPQYEWALMGFSERGTRLDHDFTTDVEVSKEATARALALRDNGAPPADAAVRRDSLARGIAHALLHAILSGQGRPAVEVAFCGKSPLSPEAGAALQRVLRGMPKASAQAPPDRLRPGIGGLFTSLIWAVLGEARWLSTPDESLEQLLAQLQQASQRRPVPVQVNLVGINVPAGSELETTVRGISEAGGGRYVPVASVADLPTAMAAVMSDPGTPSDPPRVTARPGGSDGQPAAGGVLRTLVYHQITNTSRADGIQFYNGQEPRVSADGSRIAFCMEPAAGDPNRRARIGIVDFAGGGLRTVDTIAAAAVVDLSRSGRVVVSTGGNELRVAMIDGDGHLVLKGPSFTDVRTDGQGERIYFSAPAGSRMENGTVLEAGIYSIAINGDGLRCVAGAAAVAGALGIPVADVRSFYSGSRGAGLDVSDDGNRLVFLVNTRGSGPPGHVFTVRGDGAELRHVATATQSVSAVGISGDGRRIAWVALQTTAPARQGWTAGADGARPLMLSEKPDGSRSVSLTADGSAVLFGAEAVLYRSDGSGKIALAPQGSTVTGARLASDRLDCVNMSADGGRFVFGLGVGGLYQLATVELDPADLRGAPRLSEAKVVPWALRPGNDQTATATVRVSDSGRLTGDLVALTLYGAGAHTTSPWGTQTLRDDAQGTGDAQPGDGVYTRDQLRGAAEMPAEPWTLRFRAETTGADGRAHATAIEVGPISATPSAQPVATQPTTTQPTTTQPTTTQPTTTQPTTTQPTTTQPTTTQPTTTQPTTTQPTTTQPTTTQPTTTQPTTTQPPGGNLPPGVSLPPTTTTVPTTTQPTTGQPGQPPTGEARPQQPGSPLPDPPAALTNVALRKPAYQSSRSRISLPDDPQGAVDGIRNGKFGFHTDWETHPWWLVDLGQTYVLQELRVFNCLEYSERARCLTVDFSVDGQNWQRVYAHPGQTFGGVDGNALILNLRHGSARYVLLRLGDDAPHYLHLDEVEAYGLPAATGGTAPTNTTGGTTAPGPATTPGQQTGPPATTGAEGTAWRLGLDLDIVGGRLTVAGVMRSSLADVPLFQSGDQIVRLNGADTSRMTMGNVRGLLDLPVGGQVTIEFVRPGTGLSGTIVLTRR